MSRGGRRGKRLARRHERMLGLVRKAFEQAIPEALQTLRVEAVKFAMAHDGMAEQMNALGPRLLAHAVVETLRGRMPESMEANEHN